MRNRKLLLTTILVAFLTSIGYSQTYAITYELYGGTNAAANPHLPSEWQTIIEFVAGQAFILFE